MNKQVNGLSAVGGVMIMFGFPFYLFMSYSLAWTLWIIGTMLLIAGIMSNDKGSPY